MATVRSAFRCVRVRKAECKEANDYLYVCVSVFGDLLTHHISPQAESTWPGPDLLNIGVGDFDRALEER